MVTARRRFLRDVGVTLAVASVAGCGRDEGRPRSNILNRGNGPEPDSLDPHRATTTEAINVLRDLYEPLARISKNGSVAPGAATRWDRSADGLEYTFHLRSNLRWSNGDTLGADAFAAGLRRLVDPATASQYAQVIDVIRNAKAIIERKEPPTELGAEVLSPSSLRIHLDHPAPYLPALLAHPGTAPLHQGSFAKHGEQFVRPGNAISNGAFSLADWQRDQYVRIDRNPHYWNAANVRLDGVKYLHLADENAELRAYRAGELHVTNTVPRGQFDWVRENLHEELQVAPVLNTYFYGFNLDREPFANQPGLRRALSLVIDRERLAKSVLRMGELPAYSWVPPGIENYTPQPFPYARLPMAERIAEAKALYSAAGFSPERPLRFSLSYNSGEVHSKVAIAVSSMWKEALGVECLLNASELRTLLSNIDRREFDVFRLGWQGDYADAYSFLQVLRSDFGVNLPHYKSRQYDQLLQSASQSPGIDDRRSLLESAESAALEDHPLLPLYFYVSKHLIKPEVRGWYANASNVVYSSDLALADRAQKSS
jgi:oligopeptide transport system substrate-binding protein